MTSLDHALYGALAGVMSCLAMMNVIAFAKSPKWHPFIAALLYSALAGGFWRLQ